ncbi:hypothetical protein ZHAS_00006164 [Anopheles sinensis]|uniref:DUF4789 domain-containing protein n=1 Tax=Anopheles sinensis TaxID=74873 RepID=A0A084VLB9_ANOSI|nr:hypothetical protein ZHAS_00006164 [Anopheles sinensis]
MMDKFYFTLCVVFLYTAVQLSTCGPAIELFAYPADEAEQIKEYLQNAHNRTPVFIPGKCSPNEILYPGDHADDWVCDCRPGYVYYPNNDSCYALFTKGFCQPGEYVDLERPSMLVKCTQNTCTDGKKVPFRGQCVELNRHDKACPVVKRKRFVVGVNTTTLQLDCVVGELDLGRGDYNGLVLFEGAKRCSSGTKASYNELCVENTPK